MPMGIELFYDGEIVFRPGEKTPIHLHHGITLPGKLHTRRSAQMANM
jgi:hypothetical protein